MIVERWVPKYSFRAGDYFDGVAVLVKSIAMLVGQTVILTVGEDMWYIPIGPDSENLEEDLYRLIDEHEAECRKFSGLDEERMCQLTICSTTPEPLDTLTILTDIVREFEDGVFERTLELRS